MHRADLTVETDEPDLRVYVLAEPDGTVLGRYRVERHGDRWHSFGPDGEPIGVDEALPEAAMTISLYGVPS